MYDPNIPKLGLGYQRLRKPVAEEVLRHAQAVCSIALSTELITARFTASTAIIACGPWFHERLCEEQELLLHLLKRADVENVWPTASLAQALVEEWNW